MAGCRLSCCCWPRRAGPAAAPVQWKTLRASISTTLSPETGWWNCEGIATDIATWDWGYCTYVCIGRTVHVQLVSLLSYKYMHRLAGIVEF